MARKLTATIAYLVKQGWTIEEAHEIACMAYGITDESEDI